MRAHKNFCAAPRSLYRFTSRPTVAERQFGSLQKVIQELSKNFPEARRGGMSKQMKPLYEFGPFRLDYAERRMLRDGEPVALTPMAFETLMVLIERRGRLVEKEELLQTLWPDSFVEEHNLANNISTLRKALGEAKDAAQYIETVPKRGYRFVAEVREVPDDVSEVILQRHTVSSVITEEEIPTQAGEGAASGTALSPSQPAAV